MSNTTTATKVVVWGMESGPQGAGRPVQAGRDDIGIAENLADVFRLIEEAGITTGIDLIWRHGDADTWD